MKIMLYVSYNNKMKIMAWSQISPEINRDLFFLSAIRVDVGRKLILIFSCNKKQSLVTCLTRWIAVEATRHATSKRCRVKRPAYEETGLRGCQRPLRREEYSKCIVTLTFCARGDRNWVVAMRCDAPRSNPFM